MKTKTLTILPFVLVYLLMSFANTVNAQENGLIQNIYERNKISLNGTWKLIVDPMKTGIKKRKYRRDFPADETTKLDKGPLIEYEWDSSWDITVPSDWNSQFEQLQWYEGLAWYRKKFELKEDAGYRYFLYFEAVNYKSDVYINGKKLGMHEGGFTPFQFEITNDMKSENSLVLSVDNQRVTDGIPAADFDWWNYGGITRPVWVIKVPDQFIENYTLSYNGDEITGSVQMNGNKKSQSQVNILIPELDAKVTTTTNKKGYAEFSFRPKNLLKWSPENPKRYEVRINAGKDSISDLIGFRTIETKGTEILLNGNSVFLKGICIHEEAIGKPTRTLNWQSARRLLEKAKLLNANFVRLAHYPHSEKMTRLADSLGLMVWSEIPVYWEDIDYQNPKTLALAKKMLTTNYFRDRNRASVIIWSVANETPINDHRTAFLTELISTVKNLDNTRLVTAALKVSHEGGTKNIDDPLGAYLDILAINQYVGWYGEDYPDKITNVRWTSEYSKPMLLSEFGAGALYGNYGGKMTRWTEEYQAYFIDETMKMTTNIPFLKGTMPWILKDFRTPRRYHGKFQNYWNRKGLIDENGNHKRAFQILQDWYKEY